MGLQKKRSFGYIDIIFISSIVASLGTFIYFIIEDEKDNIIISGSVTGGLALIYMIIVIVEETRKNTVYNVSASRVKNKITEDYNPVAKDIKDKYSKSGIEYNTKKPEQAILTTEEGKTANEIIKERKLESAKEDYEKLLKSSEGLINSPEKETDILKEIVRLKKELNILENNRALEREARNLRNEINTGEIKTLKNPRVIRDDDVEAAARDSTIPAWMESLEFSNENKN